MKKTGFSLNVSNLFQTVKKKNKTKTLLMDVNFSVNAGEFIAIVGCSGAGKTTLMNVISGYNTPSTGNVTISGLDLNDNLDILKGDICYVPQEEIISGDLTLQKSLEYSALLRISDKNKEEIKLLIKEVIDVLELNGCENTLVRKLSGGERKRAFIAIEMLSDPKLFLLDEPTSGLDSNIERKVMLKLRSLADLGSTVIITAHTVLNLKLCDKIIFMGQNGKICYYGSYEDAAKYFKVKEFVEIYDVLKEDTNSWFNKYQNAKYKKEKTCKKEIKSEIVAKPKVDFFTQTKTLIKRYISSLLNNKVQFTLIIGQALALGIAICLCCPRDGFTVYPHAMMGLAAFTLAAIWVGMFNTLQEIVKEKPIFKREYMNGLRISSYLSSKIIISFVLCLYQSLVVVTLIHFYVDPRPDSILIFPAYINLLMMFFLVAFCSSMMGLFISAIVKKTESTLIISPVYMMLQLLCSGAFIPFNTVTKVLSQFVIGKWAIEGFGVIVNMEKVAKSEIINFDFSKLNFSSLITSFDSIKEYIVKFASNLAYIESASVQFAFNVSHLLSVYGVILIHTTIFILLAIYFVRRNVKKRKL